MGKTQEGGRRAKGGCHVSFWAAPSYSKINCHNIHIYPSQLNKGSREEEGP